MTSLFSAVVDRYRTGHEMWPIPQQVTLEILFFVQYGGVFHEGQAGCRVNRSCMDNGYSLNESVQGRRLVARPCNPL